MSPCKQAETGHCTFPQVPCRRRVRFGVAASLVATFSLNCELMAKHESMSAFVRDPNEDQQWTAPAFPFTGGGLFARLLDALARERGYKMTIERVARIVGCSRSTAGYRVGVARQSHIHAFICLLERMSDEERFRFLREVCRTLPTILHPRLAVSPKTVVALVDVIKCSNGITLIRGGTEESRRFLLTALGHTFPQIDNRHRTAGGLDSLPPTNVVPIETVIYLRHQPTRERMREAINAVWPRVKSSIVPLLLFNGTWSIAPERQQEILDWAKCRHVIIADAELPDPQHLVRAGAPSVRTLSISQARANPARIHINF